MPAMNALLSKAIAEVETLPEEAQESIAAMILEEIEAERAWDDRFATSQKQLSELVRRARAEVAEEGALPFDPSDRPRG
jgi:hypothetical protein